MTADLAYYKDTTPDKEYTAAEEKYIDLLLVEAYEAIIAFTGGNWASSTGSEIPANNIQCRIVRRYFENPEGITSEGVDGYTYNRSVSTDGIELSAADEKQLVRYEIKKSNPSAIFTLETNRNWGYVW